MNKVRVTDPYAIRQAHLRALLEDARRRDNWEDEQLVLKWIDDEYVSRAHLRAQDRDIVRLRRWLRDAA